MKFLATAELGRLCKWLRILGYDCEYCAAPSGNNLAYLKIRSLQEDRVILTRNIRLGKRSGYKVVRVESDFVEDQLRKLMEELDQALQRGIGNVHFPVPRLDVSGSRVANMHPDDLQGP